MAPSVPDSIMSSVDWYYELLLIRSWASSSTIHSKKQWEKLQKPNRKTIGIRYLKIKTSRTLNYCCSHTTTTIIYFCCSCSSLQTTTTFFAWECHLTSSHLFWLTDFQFCGVWMSRFKPAESSFASKFSLRLREFLLQVLKLRTVSHWIFLVEHWLSNYGCYETRPGVDWWDLLQDQSWAGQPRFWQEFVRPLLLRNW